MNDAPKSPTGSQSAGLTCYVVVARRWGGSETHHYIVNAEAFFDIEEAKALAVVEEDDRGGKYECTVETLRIEERYHTKTNSNHQQIIIDFINGNPVVSLRLPLDCDHSNIKELATKNRTNAPLNT